MLATKNISLVIILIIEQLKYHMQSSIVNAFDNASDMFREEF